MNKTVNINLAGIFFHIDEDAYLKLQRYLDAIKRSFTDSQGRDEIITDIEARIAELFTENLQNERQVVSSKLVDQVITIMGQPEDYLVDEEIFEDEPTYQYSNRPIKKLFRDTDNSYIGGVSAGLAHYLAIDAVWLRLLWIILAIGSGGSFILIYILFWILVPEAKTTTDKLMMKGEEVNISNIEKKIKKGFENVADSVKNVDYQKYGSKVKSSSKTFFDTLGDIFMVLLTIFAKFIGVILILIGAITIISLVIGLFGFGFTNAINLPVFDFIEASAISIIPFWLTALMAFFIVGIPFFFLFYLGLKILINNLKSIGNIAKFSLLGIWIISLLGLIAVGILQANEIAFESNTSSKHELAITTGDTLYVKMQGNANFSKSLRRNSGFDIVYDENDTQQIFSRNVRLVVKSTKDSLAYINITKIADGRSHAAAKERAGNINYEYMIVDKVLNLDGYFLTEIGNKYRNQKVEVELYLPEGSVLNADENTWSYHSNTSSYGDILDNGFENKHLQIINNGIKCLDCDDDNYNIDINISNEKKGVQIDSSGVKINGDDAILEINSEGVKGNTKNIKVNINEEGVEIKSKNN
jgi:phage shock protein PspC (stress-responsive transcriptional regulator)